ncbi:MAG: hypothetical protein ACREIA_15425 [Opitutaceae bacterium]
MRRIGQLVAVLRYVVRRVYGVMRYESEERPPLIAALPHELVGGACDGKYFFWTRGTIAAVIQIAGL